MLRRDEPLRVMFTPPATMTEAEERRLELITALADIDAQFADRDRRDVATGARLSAHAYWAWRSKAIAAHRYKSAELRALNNWIRLQHRQAHQGPATAALRDLVAAAQVGNRQQLLASVQQLRGILDLE